MTAKRKFQWVITIPIIVILLPMACGTAFFVTARITRDAPNSFSSTMMDIEMEKDRVRMDTELRTELGDMSLAQAVDARNQAEATAERRNESELMLKLDDYLTHSLSKNCAQIFGVITLVAAIFSFFYFILLYTKSSALLSFLKSRGYVSLTLRDAAMIYASVRNLAFTLSDAATVLVLPGYGPDPDSLIRYLRDHANYKLQKPSPS